VCHGHPSAAGGGARTGQPRWRRRKRIAGGQGAARKGGKSRLTGRGSRPAPSQTREGSGWRRTGRSLLRAAAACAGEQRVGASRGCSWKLHGPPRGKAGPHRCAPVHRAPPAFSIPQPAPHASRSASQACLTRKRAAAKRDAGGVRGGAKGGGDERHDFGDQAPHVALAAAARPALGVGSEVADAGA
jgi:hypothetical protein